MHRYRQYFQGGVFWLDFQNEETALLSITEAGKAYGWEEYPVSNFTNRISRAQRQGQLPIPTLAVDEHKSLELLVGAGRVQRQWQLPIPTLLIFDNCEDIDLARKYLPVGGGARVLLTSRNQTWVTEAHNQGIRQILITPLPRPDSIALLQKFGSSLGSDMANKIADAVGDLPLALHVAGSYLGEYSDTAFGNPVKYVEQLQSRLLGELEQNIEWWQGALPTQHVRSVRATFMLSLERLRFKADNNAQLSEEILVLLAHFAPGLTVPQKWIDTEFAEDADSRRVVNAIRTLFAVGVLQEPKDSELRLHRLITEVILSVAEAQTRLTKTIQCERVLLRYAPIYGETHFIQNMEMWLPHARHAVTAALVRRDEQSANFVQKLSELLDNLAFFAEATRFSQEAVSIRKEILGARHPDTATSLNHLALLYHTQGQFEQALPLIEEAISIRKEVLGTRHPDTASSLYVLAGLYQDKGEYKYVLSIVEEAISIRKEVLGTRHPNTLNSLHQLGYVYLHQGEYKRALAVMEEVISIRKEVLGSRHPDTALSLNNLGVLYFYQKEFDKAITLYDEALSIWEESLGPRHPYVATSLLNLASWDQTHKQYSSAIQNVEEAMSIYKDAFGEYHDSVALCLTMLAFLYPFRRRIKEALPLVEKALLIYKKLLGSHHIALVQPLLVMAELYYAQDAYDQVLRLSGEALSISRNALGVEHPTTQDVLRSHDEFLKLSRHRWYRWYRILKGLNEL